MDRGITECMFYLGKVFSKTRYDIQSIKPCNDFYKGTDSDTGEPVEWMKEVAEITLKNGDVIYADIGGDSNSAAIKDVMMVIEGEKKPSTKVERLVYIEK